MSTAITITDTRRIQSECYPSIGGVGGYQYQPDTTVVTWSDGTRLVVTECSATAEYRGTTYKMPHLNTSIHDEVARRWTAAICQRLQRDMHSSGLADRVRAGWQSDAALQIA